MHNPNPFDFVWFDDNPKLLTPAEFKNMGKPLSGYLEVKLKALTPIHIAGNQRDMGHSTQSNMFRQGNRPCIPGSSIRGCLRSFIEAVTSGWVSQATLHYEKKYKERAKEFLAFEDYPEKLKGKNIPYGIEQKFMPHLNDKNRIDVASYLFGFVIEKDSENNHKDIARKSKISIDDVFISDTNLDAESYETPDLAEEAFMGGGKAKLNNWWYFHRGEIHFNENNIAQMMGNKFRGRKFYFHQDPQKCIQYYRTHQDWFGGNKKCKPIKIECLKEGEKSESFRIYVDHVPEKLMAFLCMVLRPGKVMRHKLGYGKPFGYGSVEFELLDARLRKDTGSRIPTALENFVPQVEQWLALAWEEDKMAEFGLGDNLIHQGALEDLAMVLGWVPSDNITFTYPPFKKGYFQQVLRRWDIERKIPQEIEIGKGNTLTQEEGEKIAEELWATKKTIDFEVYQSYANGWDEISKREP